MRAIILAAGRSTRIREKTKDKPKCLLTLNDSTILGYQLNAILYSGIRNVSIVVGYMKEKVEEYLDEARNNLDLEIETIFNEDYAITDNAYSLSMALNKSDDESVIILDGDILFDPTLLNDLVVSESENSLLVDNSRKALDEDCKVEVSNGYATAIGKKKESEFIYTSIIKIGGSLLEAFKSELNKNREKMEWYSEPLDRILLRNPSKMEVQWTNGRPRCEIDTEEDLKKAYEVCNLIVEDD